jgi:hypothetical protein
MRRRQPQTWKIASNTGQVFHFCVSVVEARMEPARDYGNQSGRLFPPLRLAHTALETGGPCRFAGPSSARGSLAEPQSSQRLVVGPEICLLTPAADPSKENLDYRMRTAGPIRARGGDVLVPDWQPHVAWSRGRGRPRPLLVASGIRPGAHGRAVGWRRGPAPERNPTCAHGASTPTR